MPWTPLRVCWILTCLVFAASVLPWSVLAANNPIPLINNPLVPTSVAPGGAAFTLTVNGTGFVSGAKVNWNGAALSTTFVSSSQLTSAVPAANIATAGTAWITVTNPAPGGGTSLPAFLKIATPNTSPSFVSYIQGTPFNEGTPFNHPGISSMITGDFNNDGKLDLAFVGDAATPAGTPGGSNSFSVCIELGNGDGSFQSPVCSLVRPPAAGGQQDPGSIVAGDFNGDGKLDLAIANGQDGTNTVSVFLGNGDGTLQAPSNSPAGTGPTALAAGDFNKDGRLDLVVYNLAEGSVTTTFLSVLLGNGDGSFQSPATYTSGLSISSLGVGDFNGDGKLDIVLTNESAATPALDFLPGNGDGTFGAPQNAQTTGEFDSIFSVADLNDDGKLDILLANPQGNTRLLFGNGDGSFQPVVNYSVGTSASGNTCNLAGAVDALSADGKLDVIFCQGNADPTFLVGYQLGNGNGTFQSPVDLSTPNWAFFVPSGIVTGDFSGNGRVDIVASMTQEGIGNNPASLVVFLQGSFPVASATPAGLVFASQPVGTPSAHQTVTVMNTGTLAVSLSSVSIAGPNAAEFAQTNTCGSILAGGASCEINVTFTPTAAGNPVATLNVADSAVGSPQTVALAGTGLGPIGSLSPSSVTFSSQYVGTSGLPQTVTLTNMGTAALTIASVTTSPSDFGSLSSCGNIVVAGASCAIGVFFDPTAGGARTGTLTVTDNAGNPQTISLNGTGQDFSVAASASASASVTRGQTASYSLAVAPAGGFAQSVSLSCSGAPAMSSCSVSPSSVALNGSASQTVSVTVTTTGSGSTPPLDWRLRRLRPPSPLLLAPAAALLLFLIAIFARQRRQRLHWAPTLALATLACLCFTLTSCGGGSSSGGGGGGGTGTQSGTYTITVTGTFTSGSTNLAHATKLTLVVQ